MSGDRLSEGSTAGASRISEAFTDGPAFVPYLAAGDPTYDASLEYVESLERGGADVIELGLPFSEPIAEGPTIQEAVVRSLEAGMTPDRFFSFVEDLDVQTPLVCMTYYNLVFQYGSQRGPRPFVERATEAGIDGFVIPDLPAEEAAELRTACDEFGRDLISIVAPTTEADRLRKLVDLSSGYLYVQARLGVTGARSSVSDRTAESLARLQEFDVPKAVGFGISSGEQAATVVEAGADGVIVGSALVEIVAEGHTDGEGTTSETTRTTVEKVGTRLEELARELKGGAERGYERRLATTDGAAD